MARSPSSSVVTAVGDDTAVQTLLAANTNRQGYSFYNASTAVAYVKLGSAASTSSYSFQLAASGGFYESPADPIYAGIITAVWASDAGGSILVTELI